MRRVVKWALIVVGVLVLEIAKTSALKGFEDVAQVNPRISLAGVLESAYDELAKK